MNCNEKKVSEFVIKVASRCNLNCSYCYIYNKGDFTYKTQPKFISQQNIDSLMARVKEHLTAHDIPHVSFIFHGGEPLLAGLDFFREFRQKCDDMLSGMVSVDYHMQTNGVLLDEATCCLLTELNVQVGISIDGVKEIHNQSRVYHSGKGSFDDVMLGLAILKNYQPLSVISVININSDPKALYQFVRHVGVDRFSVLLPDCTYDNPDPSLNMSDDNHHAPYGEWLVALFEEWIKDNSSDRPVISLFRNIINLLLGEEAGDEGIGRRMNHALTIQTDGSYEIHDVLKICGDGFSHSSMTVDDSSIDRLLGTALADAYYLSHQNLCARCQACPVGEICGGGFVAHRYSSGRGFDNASVYCKDLMRIITHIQNRLIRLLPAAVLQAANLYPMSYREGRAQLMASEGCTTQPSEKLMATYSET